MELKRNLVFMMKTAFWFLGFIVFAIIGLIGSRLFSYVSESWIYLAICLFGVGGAIPCLGNAIETLKDCRRR